MKNPFSGSGYESINDDKKLPADKPQNTPSTQSSVWESFTSIFSNKSGEKTSLMSNQPSSSYGATGPQGQSKKN